MSYSSMTFLFLFLPAAFVGYYAINKCGKYILNTITLLLLSLCFYAWSGHSTLAIFLVYIILIYLSGKAIEHADRIGRKNKIVITTISVMISVVFLGFYKYIEYLSIQIGPVADSGMEEHLYSLIVPLGISFIVFSGLSYTIDVYRGVSCGSFLDCLLYMTFFPKVISGPIVQWKDFSPQIKGRRLTRESVSDGIDLIIIGLAKKVIIADVLGAQIALINSEIPYVGVDTQTVWLRSIMYYLQLYCDFSGYSDIAVGISLMLGFKFKSNFDHPYISQSVSEFWRRWHISLGSWFREYVYIPLGGSRRGNVYVNLFIVFLLTGIWHGDNWTFIIWGILNGIAVVFERMVRGKAWYEKIPAVVKWSATTAFVFFAWVLFMAPNIGEAVWTIKHLFSRTAGSLNFTWQYYLTNRIKIIIMAGLLGSWGVLNRVNGALGRGLGELKYMVLRKGLLLVLFILDILFIVNSSYSPFIYFQF